MVTKKYLLMAVLALFALGMVGVLLVLAASAAPAAPYVPVVQSSPDYMSNEDAAPLIATGETRTAIVAGTRSMEPALREGEYVLERIPKSPSEISVGDIITYNSQIHGVIIIHRVISIGSDDYGWFVRTKGDNAQSADEEIIRFPQVTGIAIAILY